MTPEKAIENQILGFLRMINVFCWKNQSVGIFDPVRKVYRKAHSPYAMNGVSDILGVIEGRLLAIEVKSEKGIIRPEQRIFIARVNEDGGIAFVARSLQQAIDQLVSHFPKNERLRQFAQAYAQSGPHEH